jgi:type III pantothenate kinase
MLLCIDIGNTNITFGLFHQKELIGTWRIATSHSRMPDEYAVLLINLLKLTDRRIQDIDGAAIASVVPPLTAVFEEVCQRYLHLKPLVVDAGVKTGVKIRYDSPRDVGADRVVDAAAVFKEYGGPACIVDFGTATTFDAIDRQGDYLGGAIAPGIGIAAEALFSRTAKLQRVELRRPPQAIGTNTVYALQSGLLFGYVGLVEGLVARFRQELGPKMRVIGTGGLAEIIAAETKVVEIVDPWITLKGLQIIWNLNRP